MPPIDDRQTCETYTLLREHLQARPRVVHPFTDHHADWHRVPDDLPAAPVDRAGVETLLGTLPPRQCVVVAMTAAQMVVEVWNRDAAESGAPASARLAPTVGLRNLRRWLAGDFRLTDLGDSVDNLILIDEQRFRRRTQNNWWGRSDWAFSPSAAGMPHVAWTQSPHAWSPSRWALMSCALAGMAAFSCREGSDGKNRVWPRNHPAPIVAGTAVAAASQVHSPAARGRGESPEDSRDDSDEDWRAAFFRRWWARCTARLAIRDVTTATIT